MAAAAGAGTPSARLVPATDRRCPRGDRECRQPMVGGRTFRRERGPRLPHRSTRRAPRPTPEQVRLIPGLPLARAPRRTASGETSGPVAGSWASSGRSSTSRTATARYRGCSSSWDGPRRSRSPAPSNETRRRIRARWRRRAVARAETAGTPWSRRGACSRGRVGLLSAPRGVVKTYAPREHADSCARRVADTGSPSRSWAA